MALLMLLMTPIGPSSRAGRRLLSGCYAVHAGWYITPSSHFACACGAPLSVPQPSSVCIDSV